MLHLAAVDLGASSGRVMRGQFDGSVLRMQEAHRFRTHTVHIHDRLYWNIYAIYSDIKRGLHEAADHLGPIVSMAVDSWAVDYGLLNKDGQLMGLPRHYRDARTIDIVHEWVQSGQATPLFERTGIQLMPINSLFQILADMKDTRAMDEASDLLMIPDLMHFFLTGMRKTEFTNATTTQLVNATSKTWDVELMKRLGIPSKVFQPIVQPGSILGDISDSELRSVSGLHKTKVVNVASHDTGSAVLAVPNQSPKYAYISSGTWSLLGTTVDTPIINETTLNMNFTNEGGYHNYRFLKNIMGLWLLQQTLVSMQDNGNVVSMEEVMDWVDVAPSFHFFFNVDDERFLHPGDMPARIRSLCEELGQSPPTDNQTLVRGILENLAFRYRVVLENMEAAIGYPVDVLHIVGGGCRNRHLCQFTANVTNRMVIAGPAEATATGNLLMQLVAVGELSGVSDMSDVLLKSSETVLYEPQQVDVWENAFSSYQEAIHMDGR